MQPDFLPNDWYGYRGQVNGKELSKALEKHYSGEAIVIPIIVRPVDWTHSKLATLQALPQDAIPIAISDNRDMAWLNVVSKLRDACQRAIKLRVERKHGEATTSVALATALGDVVDDIQRFYDRDDLESVTGIPTGLLDLDALTDGLHQGEVSIVASAPMMDREGFLIGIAAHVAVDLRLPVAVVCAHSDIKYIAGRFLTTVGNMPVGRVRRGQLDDEDWDQMTMSLGKLHDAPIDLIPASNISLNDLIQLLTKIAARRGALPLIVVDSLSHLTEDKGLAVRRLREFIKDHNRTLIAGVGLENDPTERQDKRPTVRDLGQWASINDDIDCLMLMYSEQIYRPDTKDFGVTELIVARARTGTCGTARLAYLANSQRFSNLAH